MASADADWSNIQLELLLSILETQRNALDNCAAACTCVRWRRAALQSHIKCLHLHADSPSYNTHWRNFFKARQSIVGLKLTSSFYSEPEHAAQLAEFVEQGCCLGHIRLGCSLLSVSQDFLGIPGCISHLTGLRHLKLKFHAALPESWKWKPLKDLSFLTHLEHLELYQVEEELDDYPTLSAFPPASRLLPVEHLRLEQMTDTWKFSAQLFQSTHKLGARWLLCRILV